MSLVNSDKVCPFISSPEKLTPCIDSQCMMFDGKAKSCRIVLIDQNVEAATRKLLKSNN